MGYFIMYNYSFLEDNFEHESYDFQSLPQTNILAIDAQLDNIILHTIAIYGTTSNIIL